MKCRWIKQRMHGELDITREVWLSRQEEAPVDLEVEFEMHETEQQSVIVQSEKAASRLLVKLGGDNVSSAAQSSPPALPSDGRAYGRRTNILILTMKIPPKISWSGRMTESRRWM